MGTGPFHHNLIFVFIKVLLIAMLLLHQSGCALVHGSLKSRECYESGSQQEQNKCALESFGDDSYSKYKNERDDYLENDTKKAKALNECITEPEKAPSPECLNKLNSKAKPK